MKACLLLGGKTYRMAFGGRTVTFEMHPQCGPVLLTRDGSPASVQPLGGSGFYEMAVATVEREESNRA